MRSQALPLITAAGIGLAVAAIGFAFGAGRPASAQFRGAAPQGGIPPIIPGINNSAGTQSSTVLPQPLEIQALDGEHFVIATREPRLVQQIGREGTAQSMLVTVVTHYTVRGDRLVPIEHVRVPTGYRPVTIEE